jgi:Microcystin-dependent protein
MEWYLGEIRLFGGNFAPQGWYFCDGSLLSIAENDALFALIGTTYGGDGINTFALPDLRGRVPIHQGVNPQSGTNYTIGQKAGSETVTLTQAQLPMHTHVPNASTTSTQSSPTGAVWGQGTINEYVNGPASSPVNMSSQTVQAVGGNQPHDNMMPYLPLSFIIAYTGIFPTQN